MDIPMVLLVIAATAAVGAVALFAAALRRRPAVDPAPLLEAQGLRIDRLADALSRRERDEVDLRGDLGRTREIVEALRAHAEEQRQAALVGWDVVRRLESVLVGGGTRGRPGENVVQDALAALPPEMVVRDFRVNGRVVEFALCLPDGRRLPVDSKWTAVRELEALDGAEDTAIRESLSRDIERCVARRAAEVAAYLDPSLTTPFAVACIPDPAFAVCKRAHGEAFSKGVVLVPYQTALPVLLALYSLAMRHGATGDLVGCLGDLEGVLDGMEQILENKVTRAGTMLHNATVEWRTHLGRARGAIARGRGIAGDGDPALRAEGEVAPVWPLASG